jgi:hypothetical protein
MTEHEELPKQVRLRAGVPDSQCGGRSKSYSDQGNSKKRDLAIAFTEKAEDCCSESSDSNDYIDDKNSKESLERHGPGPASDENALLVQQKYIYTERERYLPLANITRSLKEAAKCCMTGRNLRITKEGTTHSDFSISHSY